MRIAHHVRRLAAVELLSARQATIICLIAASIPVAWLALAMPRRSKALVAGPSVGKAAIAALRSLQPDLSEALLHDESICLIGADSRPLDAWEIDGLDDGGNRISHMAYDAKTGDLLYARTSGAGSPHADRQPDHLAAGREAMRWARALGLADGRRHWELDAIHERCSNGSTRVFLRSVGRGFLIELDPQSLAFLHAYSSRLATYRAAISEARRSRTTEYSEARRDSDDALTMR